MKAGLTFEECGRCGYIIYQDAIGILKLYYEFGDKYVVCVFVPDSASWTNVTKRPLNGRLPLLTFIAMELVSTKAPGCAFEISENFIEFWQA